MVKKTKKYLIYMFDCSKIIKQFINLQVTWWGSEVAKRGGL